MLEWVNNKCKATRLKSLSEVACLEESAMQAVGRGRGENDVEVAWPVPVFCPISETERLDTSENESKNSHDRRA